MNTPLVVIGVFLIIALAFSIASFIMILSNNSTIVNKTVVTKLIEPPDGEELTISATSLTTTADVTAKNVIAPKLKASSLLEAEASQVGSGTFDSLGVTTLESDDATLSKATISDLESSSSTFTTVSAGSVTTETLTVTETATIPTISAPTLTISGTTTTGTLSATTSSLGTATATSVTAPTLTASTSSSLGAATATSVTTGALTASGATTLGATGITDLDTDTLVVNDTSSLAAATATSLSTGTLTVSTASGLGAATATSLSSATLTATSSSTLAAAAATTMTVSGIMTSGSVDTGTITASTVDTTSLIVDTSVSSATLATTGNATVGGTLDVTGVTTLDTATVSDLTVDTVMTVSGSSDFQDITASQFICDSKTGAPDGTVQYSISGDEKQGMFSRSADNLGFACDSKSIIEFSSSSVSIQPDENPNLTITDGSITIAQGTYLRKGVTFEYCYPFLTSGLRGLTLTFGTLSGITLLIDVEYISDESYSHIKCFQVFAGGSGALTLLQATNIDSVMSVRHNVNDVIIDIDQDQPGPTTGLVNVHITPSTSVALSSITEGVGSSVLDMAFSPSFTELSLSRSLGETFLSIPFGRSTTALSGSSTEDLYTLEKASGVNQTYTAWTVPQYCKVDRVIGYMDYSSNSTGSLIFTVYNTTAVTNADTLGVATYTNEGAIDDDISGTVTFAPDDVMSIQCQNTSATSVFLQIQVVLIRWRGITGQEV